MADWSDEETDNPFYADDRNFYKLEKWTRDGTKIGICRQRSGPISERKPKWSMIAIEALVVVGAPQAPVALRVPAGFRGAVGADRFWLPASGGYRVAFKIGS